MPLFFKPDGELDSEVPASFRNALASMSASQLQQSIVPLGRIIFGRPDSVARLAAMNGTNTLLMCGEPDSARTPAEMIRMADVIGCEHILVPGAGHISNLENSSFVTGTLRRWLGEHVLTSA